MEEILIKITNKEAKNLECEQLMMMTKHKREREKKKKKKKKKSCDPTPSYRKQPDNYSVESVR